VDWAGDVETLPCLLSAETVLRVYRVHLLRPSLFLFHMWARVVCCVGVRATRVPGYLFGLGFHSGCAAVLGQAGARRCRDRYRHTRAPENPSMRGGGQRQRRDCCVNGEAKEIDSQGTAQRSRAQAHGQGWAGAGVTATATAAAENTQHEVLRCRFTSHSPASVWSPILLPVLTARVLVCPSLLGRWLLVRAVVAVAVRLGLELELDLEEELGLVWSGLGAAEQHLECLICPISPMCSVPLAVKPTCILSALCDSPPNSPLCSYPPIASHHLPRPCCTRSHQSTHPVSHSSAHTS
jgi:hypothetical protein